MKTLNDFNFKGKRAIIRVDFNVPLDANLKVTDDTRIVAAIPTIKKILEDGGSVVLMSHLGRPKGGPEDKYSLKHIVYKIEECLGKKVLFAPDCMGEETKLKCKNLKAGEVLLLENLRFYKEEEKGDVDFAKKLSEYADIYVNDAFGTAHRAHASTSVMAEFASDKCFGFLIENELKSIDKVLHGAVAPFTAIIGGAKVSSKIQIITKMMEKTNNIIIGGGMAYTFIKAQGGSVGNSLVEEDYLQMAKEILVKAKQRNVAIYLPTDTIVADAFSNDANTKNSDIDKIETGWMGLDIGPKSVALFNDVLLKSNTILWNGPLGVFEMSKFEEGTKQVAFSIAKATKNGAFSLIGGGDSVAAINKYNLSDQVSYVSTGGGALLEYIEGAELPGIKAIRG